MKGRLHLGFNSTATNSTTIPVILQSLQQIPPWAKVSLRQYQIWFGIIDALADNDDLDIFLAFVDVDNLPDFQALIEGALWQAHQKWDAIGTPASFVQAMSQDRLSWEAADAPQVENTTVDQRKQVQALAIILGDTLQANLIKAVGTVDVDVEYTVRTWGNDMTTFIDGNQRNSEGMVVEDSFYWDDEASSGSI